MLEDADLSNDPRASLQHDRAIRWIWLRRMASAKEVAMAHETREVACYLRNGSLWVGHFIVDDGELNFGDDRFDSVDGLAKLAYAEATRSSAKVARLNFLHRT